MMIKYIKTISAGLLGAVALGQHGFRSQAVYGQAYQRQGVAGVAVDAGGWQRGGILYSQPCIPDGYRQWRPGQ